MRATATSSRLTKTALSAVLVAASLFAGCGSGGAIAGAAVGAAVGSTLDDDRSHRFSDPYEYEVGPGEYDNVW